MPTRAPATVTVHLVFLARYAELMRCEAMDLTVPAPATVETVLAAIRTGLPRGGELPARPVCALNHRQVPLDAAVADGDEIALLPPVAGG